jgi:prepilin-type N-terminal cleavage/methylation domain-containing protein
MRANGFTLVEVLVVTVVIAILAAFLFPVVRSAIGSAKHSSGVSLLRQEGMGLMIYMQDSDSILPPYRAAQTAFGTRFGCATDDTWLTPCLRRDLPMLGSFAYIAGLEDEDMKSAVRSGGDLPLLADIFDANYHPAEFSGDQPSNLKSCGLTLKCEVPERIWFFYAEGSLKVQRNKQPPKTFQDSVGSPRMLFTWPGVFQQEMQHSQHS